MDEVRSSIKMSIARRCGRWQDGGAADSTDVRQGDTNAASGILIELLNNNEIFLSEAIKPIIRLNHSLP